MSAARSLSLVVLLSGLAATSASAQLSGAIFTTTNTGTVVDGNVYNTKSHVYLNAGPGSGAPLGTAGLPDGRYYFQVTNPSGSELLSTDAVSNREVIVSGGVITAHTGTHTTKNGPGGSKIVQLVPFADSSSSGREYKVWMTPVANYDPLGTGFFGFIARFSKTDNFKVKGPGSPVSQSIIRGFKFYDFSNNGVRDAGVSQEVPIAGWRIEIFKDAVLDGVTFTDDMGEYTFIRDMDNTAYVVREVAPAPGFIPAVGATWLATTPTDGVAVANEPSVEGPDFGNLFFVRSPGVGRTKGFWHNQGESLLAESDPAWRTALNGTETEPVCLRTNVSTADPAVSIFLVPEPPETFPVAFEALSEFLVGEEALGHAGFILSTQVAAAILNNTAGFMQGTVYVDRFLDGVLVSFDDMLAGVRGLLCDPGAGLTGPNDPFQELRARMLACVNEFGGINESGDLTNPQPVFLPNESPEDFPSPY